MHIVYELSQYNAAAFDFYTCLNSLTLQVWSFGAPKFGCKYIILS